MRKTIDVEDLVKVVNAGIAFSAENFPQATRERLAMAGVLTTVLMETGRYAGFGFLPSELEADGTLRAVYDNTARRYYVKPMNVRKVK